MKKIQIRILENRVTLDGYVNAVERLSKVIHDGRGSFREKIMPGAFQRSLEKNPNIPVLLDHMEDREIASTSDGSAKVTEDSIGLRATVETSDPEVVEKAKANKLRGWSFGFIANNPKYEKSEDGTEIRSVFDLELTHIALIDDRKTPAYTATSVEMREMPIEYRYTPETEGITEVTAAPKADLTAWETRLNKITKGE